MKLHYSALSLLLLPAALSAQTSQPPAPPSASPSSTAPLPPSMSSNHFMDNYRSRVLLSGRNPDAESYSASQQVASCLSRRMKDQAASLIDPTESDFDALKKALQNRYSLCMASSQSVVLPYVSAALAEQAIRTRATGLPPRTVPADAAAAKAFYASTSGVTVDSLARCLAVYSPGLANSVFATNAGSPEEAQAIANLYAQTPECGMATRPTSVTAGEQRAMLATSLYSWISRK